MTESSARCARDGPWSSGSVWAQPRSLVFLPRLDAAMLAVVGEENEGAGVWNACAPYLARQMSRVATQTPGMRDTPFWFGEGRQHAPDYNSNQQHTDFTQIRAAVKRNTLRPTRLYKSVERNRGYKANFPCRGRARPRKARVNASPQLSASLAPKPQYSGSGSDERSTKQPTLYSVALGLLL